MTTEEEVLLCLSKRKKKNELKRDKTRVNSKRKNCGLCTGQEGKREKERERGLEKTK